MRSTKQAKKGSPKRERAPGGKMFNRGILKSLDEATKKEFGRHLYQLMNKASLSPSELAKACFGETDDRRGFKVAAGRDRISKYLRGKSFPDNTTMPLLAKALGVDVAELLPAEIRASMMMSQSPAKIEVIPGHPELCEFTFKAQCTTAWATKITAQLGEQDAHVKSILATADVKERKSAR